MLIQKSPLAKKPICFRKQFRKISPPTLSSLTSRRWRPDLQVATQQRAVVDGSDGGGECPGGGAQPASLVAVHRVPLPPSRCLSLLPRSSLTAQRSFLASTSHLSVPGPPLLAGDAALPALLRVGSRTPRRPEEPSRIFCRCTYTATLSSNLHPKSQQQNCNNASEFSDNCKHLKNPDTIESKGCRGAGLRGSREEEGAAAARGGQRAPPGAGPHPPASVRRHGRHPGRVPRPAGARRREHHAYAGRLRARRPSSAARGNTGQSG